MCCCQYFTVFAVPLSEYAKFLHVLSLSSKTVPLPPASLFAQVLVFLIPFVSPVCNTPLCWYCLIWKDICSPSDTEFVLSEKKKVKEGKLRGNLKCKNKL